LRLDPSLEPAHRMLEAIDRQRGGPSGG
jgi:hypothetical protein